MLECAGIVLHVIIIIVWIREEILIAGIDECARNIRGRQSKLLGAFHFIDLTGIVVEILPDLIAKIGVRIPVADHLYRIIDADCAVVGGQDHRESQFRKP